MTPFSTKNHLFFIPGAALTLALLFQIFIAGKLGIGLLNAIFPPNVPSYFDAVYKKIQKIVQG